MSTNPAAAVCEVKGMTKTEVLALVAELKPHDHSEAVMLHWLDEIEQKVALEIHGKARGGVDPLYNAKEQLSVPAPYDRIYWTYLMSMLDFVSGNSEHFENSNALFKEAYADYARYVQRQGGHARRRRCC